MPSYHLRRSDKEVTDPEELIKPLLEADYITLALCMDNQPYIATLSHGYDREKKCINFHSAREGKKIDFLRANPTVWGQALIDNGYQQGSCDHLYHTTQFSGNVLFVEDLVEKEHALQVMINKLDENPDNIISNQLKPESIAKIHIGRIDIQEISGKKADKVIISL
jgi:nitroimidazol reductase NimA-like FMN-containing flavoprotein (pyridoxamine 5'-phosphate oxidase superfamily)